MPFSSQSRRVNERLLEYWQKLRGDRVFPLENEVNPDEIEHIWDACFVVRSEPENDQSPYRYVYLGQSLVEAYGDDSNSKEICEKLAYPPNNELLKQFEDVRGAKAPITRESEFTNSKGLLIKFRSCMLPLGVEGTNDVSYIIGAMKWKAF